MIKAIFSDFYGTLVQEIGPIPREVIQRLSRSSDGTSPELLLDSWIQAFQRRIDLAYGDAFRLQYDLALESFQEVIDRFHSSEHAKALCDRMVDHWCDPPLYADAKSFLDSFRLPLYFVTNSDNLFIEHAVRNLSLKPNGVITSERARSAKPRKEIFLYALEQAGLQAGEVIHIGDSIRGDVECPASLGIHAVWLNRNHLPVPDGVRAVSDLEEAQRLIRRLCESTVSS